MKKRAIRCRCIRAVTSLAFALVRQVGGWFWQLSPAGLVGLSGGLTPGHAALSSVYAHRCAATPLLYIPLALALASGLGILLTGWLIPPLATCFGHGL